MTETQTATATADPSVVAAKTICLALKRGRFGNSKRASMAAVTVEADKKLLGLSKTLLSSPELDVVWRIDNEVQSYLRGIAFKSLFKGGVYLIPIAMVTSVNDALTAFAVRRAAAVDAAVKTYDQRVEQTAARLDAVYSPSDYPSASAFRATFTFEWQYITFDTPTRLKQISAELFAVEQAKAAAKLTVVADECRDALRAGFASMIARLVDRLTPDADGKKKKFTATTVTNITEFLGSFAMRNVTDDAELGSLVEKARALLTGVDAPTLRESEDLRAKLSADFATLAGSLGMLPVSRSDRALAFGDGDD